MTTASSGETMIFELSSSSVTTLMLNSSLTSTWLSLIMEIVILCSVVKLSNDRTLVTGTKSSLSVVCVCVCVCVYVCLEVHVDMYQYIYMCGASLHVSTEHKLPTADPLMVSTVATTLLSREP